MMADGLETVPFGKSACRRPRLLMIGAARVVNKRSMLEIWDDKLSV